MTIGRVLAWSAVPALAVGATLLAQERGSTPPGSRRRVWAAEWTNELADPGPRSSRFTRWRMAFSGVEETLPGGDTRWVSREWTWNLDDLYEQAGTIVYDPVLGRYPVSITRTCTGGGTVTLGPGQGGASEGIPPLMAACEEVATPLDGRGTASRRAYTESTNQPPVVSAPASGCSVSEAHRDVRGDRVGTDSYSLTVASAVDAVLEFDRAPYEAFVPVPGRTLTFTARSRSGPARFRFELAPNETSYFPGYATNAYIDALFFAQHPDLRHLEGTYLDVDADFIFDPKAYPPDEWSSTGFLTVETRRPSTEATVVVTAMDYGAVGALRAYVRSEDCEGAWQPVTAEIGQETRARVSLPLDEDDNLMADALQPYHFVDSGADEDAEPEGNGTDGDGLTAFEEYRGFMIRDTDCGESATALQEVKATPAPLWSRERHVRTPPDHKNVFVYADDPLLALFITDFAWVSNLSALPICEGGYTGNDTRVVNYTLHESGLDRLWNGHAIRLESPQHGLWLRRVDDTSPPGLVGLAMPVDPRFLGPPKYTVAIDVAKPLFDPACRYSCRPNLQDLSITVRHELGHAVGVPHHGDDVAEWRVIAGRMDVKPYLSPRQRSGGPTDFETEIDPADMPEALLVEPGPSCTVDDPAAAFRGEGEANFVGCLAANVIRRGQQHSGDVLCPMRYANGDRYEAPGSSLRYLWSDIVNRRRTTYGITVSVSYVPVRVDAWGGRVLKYQNDQDDLNPPLGRFCIRPDGNGINGLTGDLNHAGDNGRRKPCSGYVIVKDAAAPDVR